MDSLNMIEIHHLQPWRIEAQSVGGLGFFWSVWQTTYLPSSLFGFGGRAGSSWHSLAHRNIIQTFAFIFICHSLHVYVSIQMFSFFIKTPGKGDEEWPFQQLYFILTNKTYKDSSQTRPASGVLEAKTSTFVNLGKYKLTSYNMKG